MWKGADLAAQQAGRRERQARTNREVIDVADSFVFQPGDSTRESSRGIAPAGDLVSGRRGAESGRGRPVWFSFVENAPQGAFASNRHGVKITYSWRRGCNRGWLLAWVQRPIARMACVRFPPKSEPTGRTRASSSATGRVSSRRGRPGKRDGSRSRGGMVHRAGPPNRSLDAIRRRPRHERALETSLNQSNASTSATVPGHRRSAPGLRLKALSARQPLGDACERPS
jgi:hypothetical protein